MSENFNEDDLSTFDNHETSKKLPLGWVILLVGLIVFGIYYIYAYTPQFSGWTQDAEFRESVR